MFESQEIEELISFRKELHTHPELSGEEKETAKKSARFFGKM